jgi:hypothetical protein
VTRLRDLAIDRGGALVALVAAIYAYLAPHYIVDGDNAELTTIGAVGGVPHPSGYPAYVLWLRAWSWLPTGSAAHTAALATATLGVATVWVLHAACRAWGARPLAATLTCAIYASAPIVIRVHVEAEVFALNSLVAAAILWLAAAGGPLRGTRRVVALGLVAGIGLSDHVTCVLLAPVGLVGAIAGVREARRGAVAAAAGVGALVLGLVPYAYLLVAPETDITWAPVDGLGQLVHHFLRRDYGGPGAFSGSGTPPPVAENLREFAVTLGRGWLVAPLVAGLAALAVRIVRPERRARSSAGGGAEVDRPRWIALAVVIAISGPLLVMRFDLPINWVSAYVAHRFHLLPMLVVAVPIAIAFDAVVARVPDRVAGAAHAIACTGFVALAGTSLPAVLHAHSPALETGIHNLLRSLPHGAVLLQSEDQLYYGAGYVQLVDDVRPDVVVVAWIAHDLPWYRARLARRGVDLAGSEVAVVERLLAQGRDVFVDVYQTDVVSELPSYPYGMMRRVLPRGASPPPIDDQLATNRELFDAFDLDYTAPSVDDEFAADMHRKYASAWFSLARELDAAGRTGEAAAARDLARRLAPQRL